MPAKRDCLDDLALIEELEGGLDVSHMAQSIMRMVQAADRIAQTLTEAAMTLTQQHSAEAPATPADIKNLAGTLKQMTSALNAYSGVYAWCMAQAKQASGSGKAHDAMATMDRLMDTLSATELRQLHYWMQRMEA